MCYQPRQALGKCGFSRGQGQILLWRLGVGPSYISPTPSSRRLLQGWPAQGLGGTAGVPWHCTRYPRPAGMTLCSLGPFTSHLGMGHPGKPEATTYWETGLGGHLGPQVACSSCILPANKEKGSSVTTDNGQIPSICFLYGSHWLDFIYNYVFFEL